MESPPSRSDSLIEPAAYARALEPEPSSGRPKLTRAWLLLITVTVILTVTSGARFLFGVVLKPVSDEFGWSRSSLTAAVMVSMVTLSLCQPFVGAAVDRIGSKRMLVAGTTLLALTMIPLSYATELWQVYLIYGVVVALGLAAVSPAVVTALVSRWFVERRGTAFAVATSGSAFGQLLIVPLGAWVLTVADWQSTYRGLALLLVLMILLALLVVRDAPTANAADAKSAHATRKADDGVGVRVAVRTSAFWLLAFGFVVCGFTMAFPNTHFIAYVDDMGMAPTHGANAIAVTAIFSIAGSVLLGMVSDRHRRSLVLAWTYLLRGAAFALLLVLPPGDFLFVYAIVLGISWTATTPLTAAIAADLYGERHIGAVFGTLFTFMNLGYGLGAYLDGAIFELAGGYEMAFAVNAALGLIAGVALWLANVERSRLRGTSEELVDIPRTAPAQLAGD